MGVGKFPWFTVAVCGLATTYLVYTLYGLYGIFYSEECPDPKAPVCLPPYLSAAPALQLSLYTSTKHPKSGVTRNELNKLLGIKEFDLHSSFEEVLDVAIPPSTRDNGSMYLHVFLHPLGSSPFGNRYSGYTWSPLTQHTERKLVSMNLLGDAEETSVGKTNATTTHWKPRLSVHVMDRNHVFHRNGIPSELYRRFQLTPEGSYLPLVYINELGVKVKDLVVVDDAETMQLSLSFSPITLGKLRLHSQILQSMSNLRDLGFGDRDLDEVRGLMSDTNVYLLFVTVVISVLHLLFDFLAFKNDVSFWRSRDSMVGLSSRTLIWRAFSSVVVLLYLQDQQTSALIRYPFAIGVFIEFWKLSKAFKVTIRWVGLLPRLTLGSYSAEELTTDGFDSHAMRYLSIALVPLCLAGSLYSLYFVPHKSWYSWSIQCLVNGVYAFGFLFMLPQLFVNYKLRSVAHLPWRALGYKAFNTFIDDLFAFIITMPTAHRIACFRDDVVFVVFLYQRWLYPVDKTRYNEYGISYTPESEEKEKRE